MTDEGAEEDLIGVWLGLLKERVWKEGYDAGREDGYDLAYWEDRCGVGEEPAPRRNPYRGGEDD